MKSVFYSLQLFNEIQIQITYWNYIYSSNEINYILYAAHKAIFTL